MKRIIKKNTIGVLVKKNDTIKIYQEGSYRISSRYPFYTLDGKKSLEEQSFILESYNFNNDVYDLIEKVVIEEDTFMLRYVDKLLTGIYKTGTYHFLKTTDEVETVTYTVNDFDLSHLPLTTIRRLASSGLVLPLNVKANEVCALYVNEVKQDMLKPGVYAFNTVGKVVTPKVICLDVNTITPQNQELLTKDKVNLRINFWVNYQITSIDTILEKFDNNLNEMLRNIVQMSLRNAVSCKTLDEVLQEKDTINNTILKYLKECEASYGVTFLDSGIKDIILPGEIKSIMNTVLIAEKKAQANVITRREETASTRSLLNTAKLMEENEILYRLKELEMIERICEKVGSINVGSTNLLENLETIVGAKKRKN